MGDKQTAEACWVSCRLIGRHVRLLAENFKELRWGRTSGSSGVVRGRQGASGGVRGHQGSSDKYNTFLTGGQFLMYKCFWELWFHFGTFRILWTSVRFSWGVATNWYKERYYLFTHWKVLLKGPEPRRGFHSLSDLQSFGKCHQLTCLALQDMDSFPAEPLNVKLTDKVVTGRWFRPSASRLRWRVKELRSREHQSESS